MNHCRNESAEPSDIRNDYASEPFPPEQICGRERIRFYTRVRGKERVIEPKQIATDKMKCVALPRASFYLLLATATLVLLAEYISFKRQVVQCSRTRVEGVRNPREDAGLEL